MRTLPDVMLLDLDDTIIVHSATAEPCWRRVCERFASNIESLSADELFAAIRDSSAVYWRDEERHRLGRLDLPTARREVVSAAFSRLGLDDRDMAYEIADDYTAERRESFRPYPGAIETLADFRQRGMRLGLVTNGNPSEQHPKIERFRLKPFFEHIFIEGEMGMGKPDMRVFEHVLDTFAIEARDAWMVGDNLVWDVEAPQKLGIFSVWIDPTGDGVPPSSGVEPDLIVPSLMDLLDSIAS